MAKGIEHMLADPDLAKAVYSHPLIKKLSPDGKNPLPSYIPSDKFALALMDIVTGKERPTSDPKALRESLPKFSEDFRQAIGAVLESSSPTLITDQQKIEAWFNDQMDRVSGWYKKNTQARIFILAIIITLAFNADTAKVAHVLWTNPAVTAKVVEAAKGESALGRPEGEPPTMVEYEHPNDPTNSKPIHVPRSGLTEDEREALGELTGWKGDGATEWKKAQDQKQHDLKTTSQTTPSADNIEEHHATTLEWLYFLLLTKLPGWVVTVLAVSLGAPFWFDMLNRFMNIRNAGRAPDEPRDKSTAAQPATAGAK